MLIAEAVLITDLWYKNTVVYSLDLETYMDANGDGIGDFEGLTRRLDYLQSLGIGAVWLAPFQPTPNRDDGYDISDYYGVDPRHGSSGDFVEFIHQADKRGIKVIMDLVVNHTSTDHPWFQQARRDPQSPYRDWYLWSKKRPANMKSGMVFPGVQKATWTYDKLAGAWYHHRFYPHQADLNHHNPAVRAEVRRIMGYWLQLGVAGFRIDAVPFVIEELGSDGKPCKQHFEYLREMRDFLQWRCGDAILLGEANVLPADTQRYFGEGGMHMLFNFWANQHLFHALATGEATAYAEALQATCELPEAAQWATFLRNHDELDLGRLSDEQRETVFARFAPEENMQLYHRGIRRRLAPMLGDRPHLELAYSLLFAQPGTPVLRYGDEVGMGDDLRLSERHAVRTPMQWANEVHGGFTRRHNEVHPVISEGVWGYPRVNVESQRRDRDSLLNWTARMIRLRLETPEIGWGRTRVLKVDTSNMLALRYDWRDNIVFTLHNFAHEPRQALIPAKAIGGERLVDLIADQEICAGDDGRFRLTLDAYGYLWARVGDLNYDAD